MPQAKQESSPGLSIELSNAPKYYTVGSKVKGEVIFNVAEDTAVGSLKLEFYGRAKGIHPDSLFHTLRAFV